MAIPKFNWETQQKALRFYEKERLRYFPLMWGQKKGSVEWKPLQNRAPTFAELAEWFQEGKPTNVAIICGGASNGLVALCFNDPDGAPQFFGQELWDRLLATTFVVKTSRGVHVYLRSDTLIPSQIVANGDNRSWLEIRADGNYIAAPPSLHPSGVLYEAIGVESIARPKNLPAFIEQQITNLGLKARLVQEDPKKSTPAEEYLKGKQSAEFNEIAVRKLLENCAFIQYCHKDAASLTEPHWWAMVHNLAVFGQAGEETTHELSKPYPQYTEAETNLKIKEAHKQRGQGKSPHLCDNIAFTCPKDCLAKKLGLKSPAGLAFRLATKEKYGIYLYHDKTGWHLDLPKLMADLHSEHSFKTIFGIVRDDILIYENGVYSYNGEKVIREECETRVGVPIMTTHTVSEVKNHIARATFTDREKFNTEKYIINLENGLLDVRTRELKPHSPDFLSTVRIPIIYDPQAKCPKVQSFLDSILREKDRKVILEFFGYSLIPDYSIPVVLILLGEGSNGKSQLLRLLNSFIGKNNCTAVSLQDIENDSFAVANLEGKLLNIQGDLSSKWLSGVGMLKKLSGQDPIYANRKHREPIHFDNFARLIFASNKPPIIEEDTLAIWRRILPLNLPNVFEGEKDIKNYVSTILTPGELSGLLNLALEGLRQLLDKGDFSYQGSYSDRSRHYTIASNPARVFVEECCNIGSDFRILKSDLYEAYGLFCKENRIQQCGEAQFGKELRQVPGLSISDKQYQKEGVRVRWWINIALKTPGPESQDIDMEV